MSKAADVSPASVGQQIRSGAVDIFPLALGVAIYGVAFGVLAAQARMGGLEVGVMGSIVFAGSSQIIAVERLAAGAGALAAILAGVALNLRILLMTASLRDELAGRPLWQVALGVHLTSDENWALLQSARASGRAVGYWYLVGGGLCIWAVWVGTTVVGSVFATALPEPRSLGLDFAFTAAFIAVLRSMWQGRTSIAPWAVSAAVVAFLVLATPIDGTWALIFGGVLGAVFAALFGTRDQA